MLFIDFLLSKEGQLIYRSLGYRSSRRDVANPADSGVEKVFLANRPDYAREFEAWSKLVQDAFFRPRR